MQYHRYGSRYASGGMDRVWPGSLIPCILTRTQYIYIIYIYIHIYICGKAIINHPQFHYK